MLWLKIKRNSKTARDNATIQIQETLLNLADKPLPPLPKKQNRFQCLGTGIKVKAQKLVEKIKSQTQEMVARIEIKVK